MSVSCKMELTPPSVEHQIKFNPQQMAVNRVYVEPFLATVLRPYQKEGVQFIYECIMGMRGDYVGQYWGALLADEPGLGKTLTCITLIWTLLQQKLYGPGAELSRILIVTPKSLVDSWEQDINKWLEARVEVFKVDRKNNHLRNHNPSIKITIISYEDFVYQAKYTSNEWDLLICDEAHVLKNPETLVTKAIMNVNCRRKILLTGTPYQNTLFEFYQLLNLANPGCLGSKKEFGKKYVMPSRKSVLGQKRMQELNELIGQYMLKRTRELIIDYLPPKQDLIIMCKPAPVQREFYSLAAELWKREGFPPLPAINPVFWHIGAHPTLIGKKCACMQDEKLCWSPLAKNFEEVLQLELCKELQALKPRLKDELETSGKLKVLFGILQQLHIRLLTPCKDRVLIVSYSCQTLDLLEKHCKNKNYTFVRLDGQVSRTMRTAIVKEFNENDGIFIFLMSAKAGGTGLNLPGASRVILFDLYWNPALDEQALARCWRGDQKRPVITYRLITAGTLEEKVLQKQIQKINLGPGVPIEIVMDVSLNEDEQNDRAKDIFSFQDGDVNLTHDIMLGCQCDGSGKNYAPVTKDDHRNLGINELRNWRHLKPRFNECLLTELDLNKAVKAVSFIFRSVVSPVTNEAMNCA